MIKYTFVSLSGERVELAQFELDARRDGLGYLYGRGWLVKQVIVGWNEIEFHQVDSATIELGSRPPCQH